MGYTEDHGLKTIQGFKNTSSKHTTVHATELPDSYCQSTDIFDKNFKCSVGTTVDISYFMTTKIIFHDYQNHDSRLPKSLFMTVKIIIHDCKNHHP